MLPGVRVLLGVERPVGAAPGAVPGRPFPGRGERLLVRSVVARRADRGLRATAPPRSARLAGSGRLLRARVAGAAAACRCAGACPRVRGSGPRARWSGSGAVVACRPGRSPRSGRRAARPSPAGRAPGAGPVGVAGRPGARRVGLPGLPRRLRRAVGRPGPADPSSARILDQGLVGSLDREEPREGALAGRIRVVQLGQVAVGALDLRLARSRRQAERSIGVDRRHRITRRSARRTGAGWTWSRSSRYALSR